MNNIHQPVLLAETLESLAPKVGGVYVDATLGGGGYAEAILNATKPSGRLIGIDLDPRAIALGQKRLAPFGKRVTLVQGNFKDMATIAQRLGVLSVDGIVMDIGISSNQLIDHDRGFSFLSEGRLDMRMSPQLSTTAADILRQSSEAQLTELFRDYGEERLARPMAQAIITFRKDHSVILAQDLVGIAARVYGRLYRGGSKVNPATKVFQALRIAVNDELENLKTAIPAAATVLAPGGRLVIVSFHSLEDAIVKTAFVQLAGKRVKKDKYAPTEQTKQFEIITKKPIIPSSLEIKQNPRSRSAKLRAIKKI